MAARAAMGPAEVAARVEPLGTRAHVAPVLTAEVWHGREPPHPHAYAQAHFQQAQGVLQAGPTPSGRSVLVRRFAAGHPYTPASIAVREPDGTVRALPWTDTEDIYGVCVVPGAELALVCIGAPGPLLELDLDTGDQEQRLAFVRWSCGFVDEDHVVVHEDGEARVYAYSVGMAPVASVVVEGMNLFVGLRRVFTLPSGPRGTLQVHHWDGSSLVAEPRALLERRVFFWSAAALQSGRRLVGSVDFQGKVMWFDAGAA
jgi:hypothetical protein